MKTKMLLLALLTSVACAEPVDMAKRAARLEWFQQAKYGFFINWGLYAIPAAEWKGKPIEGIGEWIMNRAKIPVKEYEWPGSLRLAQVE
jgi:alpha-L-fucosidase